jgi:hypothetical protein
VRGNYPSTKDANMTTTVNMFEYYHYMTKFIEVLVEKHGYDAEVMQNEWRSLNTKWMTEMATKEPASDDKEVTKCNVPLKSGKNKGKVCGKKVTPGAETCKIHTLSDDEPTKKAVATTEKADDDKGATKCNVLLKSGKNKGKTCGKKTCKHVSKELAKESEEEPAVENESDKESEEPTTVETENEEPAKESVKDLFGESDTDEEEPVMHCKHTFKHGKNKGEKCSEDPMDGSDMCKKHTK